MSTDSVTEWLSDLKRGESQAAQRLWERYLARFVKLARQRLGQRPLPPADEEDVVVEAFAAFLSAIESGRFPQLEDRDDLWQVLVMLTERRAVDHLRRELAAKRRLPEMPEDSPPTSPDDLVDEAPAPEFAMQAAEDLERCLRLLDGDILRTIAVAKMEGYTNQEIADRIGSSLRNVERKLGIIRRTWLEKGLS